MYNYLEKVDIFGDDVLRFGLVLAVLYVHVEASFLQRCTLITSHHSSSARTPLVAQPPTDQV